MFLLPFHYLKFVRKIKEQKKIWASQFMGFFKFKFFVVFNNWCQGFFWVLWDFYAWGTFCYSILGCVLLTIRIRDSFLSFLPGKTENLSGEFGLSVKYWYQSHEWQWWIFSTPCLASPSDHICKKCWQLRIKRTYVLTTSKRTDGQATLN